MVITLTLALKLNNNGFNMYLVATGGNLEFWNIELQKGA
jgi:hypothetical protein